MTIKLKELMVLERILLEFDVKYKFELDFDDAFKLHEFLKSVGKITSYAFLIQDEYHQKYKDVEKLKEYHNRVMGDTIEFDYDDILLFIKKTLNTYGDDEFQKLVETVKFWK